MPAICILYTLIVELTNAFSTFNLCQPCIMAYMSQWHTVKSLTSELKSGWQLCSEGVQIPYSCTIKVRGNENYHKDRTVAEDMK